MQRNGFIEETYFERANAIRSEAAGRIVVSERFLRRPAELRKQPPTSWPF